MKLNKASAFLLSISILSSLTLAPVRSTKATTQPASVISRTESSPAARSTLEFEENLGQYPKDVRFVAETSGYTLFLTDDEAVYVYPLPDDRLVERRAVDADPQPNRHREPDSGSTKSFVLRMKLGNERSAVRVVGEGKSEHVKNYLRGEDPAGWQRGVGNYTGVRYDNLSDGISLVWGTDARGGVSLSVEAEEGADASRLGFSFEGAESVEANADGDLVIKTEVGDLVQAAPVIKSGPQESRSAFRMEDGFATLDATGTKTRSEIPVENLSTMRFSTLVGSTFDDFGADIALDSTNNVYVTGYSESPSYPTTSGVIDVSHNGMSDVIVTKLRSSGSALLYSTFIGGGDVDAGTGIGVDSSGNIYVTGYTRSGTGLLFPTTAGAYDTTHNGSSDTFVTKINPTGSSILYSTLLGGSAIDEASDLKLDSFGNPHIVGTTTGGSPSFPTRSGSYDTTHNGSFDAFVASFNTTGNGLRYSTFVGGASNDYGYALAVDTTGVYVTGGTQGGTFPTTVGAYDRTPNGFYDTFVAKLDPQGEALIYSTLIGGNSDDVGFGIALDANRQAYITGRTSQGGSISYPTTFLAFQQFSSDDGTDSYVTKLNKAGSGLIFSTFLWGTSSDEGFDIAVDSSEEVYVTGSTYDDVTDFPTSGGAFDETHNGLFDAFLIKLTSNGRSMLYSTLLGGSDWDSAQGIAIDTQRNAYIAGYTEDSTTDFPTSSSAYDQTQNGGRDIFITKFWD